MAKNILSNQVFIYLVLAVIFIIGVYFRLYRLDQNVPPLYIDESGGHYVLEGQINNSHGNILSFLQANSVKRIFTYTWFLGLTPLGVRLPSAIYGSLFVILSYFLFLTISEKSKYRTMICLVGAFLVAVSPWSYMTSRIAHTAIPIMLICVSAHLIMYLKAKTKKEVALSFIFMLVGAYFYPSLVIISPLVILAVILQRGYYRSLRQNWPLCLIGILFFITIVSIFLFRFQGISPENRGATLFILNDPNTLSDTNQYRGLARLSQSTIFSFGVNPEQIGNKIVFNRPVAIVNIFVKNYLSFFSPDFLFLKGDHILRHSTGMVGMLLPFLLPFFILGLFLFFREADKLTKQVFIFWILISPVPAAITKDGAEYLLRVITMMPLLTYLAALGIVRSFEFFKSKYTKIIWGLSILIVGLFSIYYFLYGYFHVYPALSATSFEYGFKELSDFQISHQNTQMLIIWDGYYPNLHFRFWQKTQYLEFLQFKSDKIEIGSSNFYKMYHNLYFSLPRNDDDLKKYIKQNKNTYIAVPENFVKFYPILQTLQVESTINYPNITPAFTIYKTK